MVTQPPQEKLAWLQGGEVRCQTIATPSHQRWRIVLLGAPGIGKGTQAELISEHLGACQLSTGDVFRFANTCDIEPSPVMKEAVAYMRQGKLVPDSTVIDIVRERSRCLGCPFGFLLDGFPRTVEQAQSLDKVLAAVDQKLDAVVSYELDRTKVIDRLSGRRTCAQCKTTFHIKTKPPKVDQICDKCGGALFQREDDNPETIAVRLETYEESTKPLTGYYEKKGILKRIDANGVPVDILDRTLKALSDCLEA